MNSDDTADVTRFDIVCYDRTTGKKSVLPEKTAIRGRYAAEAEVQKLVRGNRDPNLSYTAEPSSGHQQEKQVPDCPEGLLTHKFQAH